MLTNHSGEENLRNGTAIHVVTIIKTVRGYGFNVAYLLTMIYLTLDRLLDIQLNIRCVECFYYDSLSTAPKVDVVGVSTLIHDEYDEWKQLHQRIKLLVSEASLLFPV